MKICKFTLLISALLLAGQTLFAQFQLPDPGFEDWTGEQFNGAIQPKSWNYCNVVQFGFEFNFSDRQPGRSGYCVKVQDQAMKVAGIDGGTSPGYVALGHPWAYVPGLTNISGATAGCYGGIDFSHRPDTVTLWIKRTGANWAKENYNIVFYAWKGTAQGTHYGNKGNTCTAISHTDEESDIRQALDPNVCTTTQYATEVCEAYFFERAEYNDWVQLRIPVFYFNDEIPDKCNLILSAGNYPAGRASDGLYAGNALYVDDVELIYASTIEKLYINGREWKGFDPSNTTGVQTYSLGVGATTIPTIAAYRGSGTLTNCTGAYTANFPGRKLSTSECQINKAAAAVDGAPVVITVTAEDGSSTTSYQVQFVSQPSSNARLANLAVNGTTISGFNPYITSYNVSLPYGTTQVPQVTADAQDGATIAITQPTSISGTATVQTTAQDGTTKLTYTIHFSVAQLTDNTLQNILLDGVSLPGFLPTKTTYSVSLPLGTTQAPLVTPVSAYPAGAQTIKVLKNTLADGCQISVSAPGAATARTYKLTYKIEASSYAYLSGISLNGEALSNFQPEQLSYDVVLPLGTTEMPVVSYTAGDPYQSISVVPGGLDGTTRIVVTAAAGNTISYRLNVSVEKSTNSRLAMIYLNGEPLEDFDSDEMEYSVTLPAGTTEAPAVTYLTGDDYQSVRLIVGGLTSPTKLVVKAGNGATTTYQITFNVEKSANAQLKMIYLDGDSLPGFAEDVLDYSVTIPTAVAPIVTVDRLPSQKVIISQPQTYGRARIEVTPEEGSSIAYTITFLSEEMNIPEPVKPEYEPLSNADLASILLDGVPLIGFSAEVTDYTITLEKGELVPAITAEPAANKVQCMVITMGEAGATSSIRVLAEDSVTFKDYFIHFPIARSSNTALASIDAEGITFLPEQLAYNVELPIGFDPAQYPVVDFERGDVYQTVEKTVDANALSSVTTLHVVAETGAERTYTVTYTILQREADNVLKRLTINGIAPLDSATLNARDTCFVRLPKGMEEFVIISWDKNYPEQQVLIANGGVLNPTTIKVLSGRAGEPVKTYTIVPLPTQRTSQLSAIYADGTLLPNFNSGVHDYVYRVESTLPAFTYEAIIPGLQVTTKQDTKHWQALVKDAAENDSTLYNVWFFYPQDTIPNADFSQSAVAQYNNAYKPAYWQVPADAADNYNFHMLFVDLNYWTGPEVYAGTDDEGAFVGLKSEFSQVLCGTLPGMMTLGTVNASLSGAGSSTSSISGGIPFRNSPDSIWLEYNPVSSTRCDNWRLITYLNDEEISYPGTFDNAGIWQTTGQALPYTALPSSMNIVINSFFTENTNITAGTLVDRQDSELKVRKVGFVYNSALDTLFVDSVPYLPKGLLFDTLQVANAEDLCRPILDFKGHVADQGRAFSWNKRIEGNSALYDMLIRNIAEDGTFSDYTFTLCRPASSSKALSLSAVSADQRDIQVAAMSPHARLSVDTLDGQFVVRVLPEIGEADIAFFAALRPFAPLHLTDTLWGTLVPNGVDSVAADTTIYQRSDNAYLADLKLDGTTIAGFAPYELSYSVYTSALLPLSWQAADDEQTISMESHHLADGTDLTYIYVRAGDGTLVTYSVHQTHVLPSDDASLSMIRLNGEDLSAFESEQLSYSVVLPPHSAFPDVQAILSDGYASAETTRSGNVISVLVTAEDGVTQRTYSLTIDIQLSPIHTLDAIYLDGENLETFDASLLIYNITLPYGTTSLPEVTWLATETYEIVSSAITPLSNREGEVVVHVVAEDGSAQDYTLHFNVALSNLTTLSSITLDGTPLATFDEETLIYNIVLPYGTTNLPEVNYTTTDAAASAQLIVTHADTVQIVVIAEDGVATSTYTLAFSIAPSDNALLDMIFVNGTPLENFDKETFEYELTLPHDAPALQTITWTAGDEQQTITLAQTEQLITLHVKAGNGDENEYTIVVNRLASDNNYLADLQVNGQTIEGFRRDSFEYHLIYPVGTEESDLLTSAAFMAIPEDADAQVTLSDNDDYSITVLVVAANGDPRAYVVTQEILLSTEARLQMIYLDSVPLKGFSPDVFEYTYIIGATATAPAVSAEAMDARAEVEYGLLEEDANGYSLEIDGVAEDGSRLTYTLYFEFANWSPTVDANEDNYIIVPLGEGRFKAVTTGVGVQVGIFDFSCRRLALAEVPTADPNDVTVEVREDGRQVLVDAAPGANGFEFTLPEPGVVYFYCFFDSRTKRIAKGGKLMRVN